MLMESCPKKLLKSPGKVDPERKMLTGNCQTVAKSQQNADREMKMLTGTCPKVFKTLRKSRPGDENVNGDLSKSC